MKTKTLILGLLMLSTATIYAQDRREDLQVAKIAFLTKRLDLSPKEAQAFWPVFNEMENKREVLGKELKKSFVLFEIDRESATEKEFLDLVTQISKHKVEQAQLEADYSNRFVEIIGAEKTLLLIKSERDFRGHLLEKLRERREKGADGPPRRSRF